MEEFCSTSYKINLMETLGEIEREVNMSKFKVGDKVVRIRGGSDFNYDVHEGEIYTVSGVRYFDDWNEIALEGKGFGWSVDNFKLYEEKTMKQFTKSDLVVGKHVVEFRDGTRVMLVQVMDKVVGFNLKTVGNNSGLHYQGFDNLEEDLTYPANKDYDVVKVYQVTEVDVYYQCYDYNLKLIWQRPTKSPEQIEYENLMAKIDELKAQAEKLKPNV